MCTIVKRKCGRIIHRKHASDKCSHRTTCGPGPTQMHCKCVLHPTIIINMGLLGEGEESIEKNLDSNLFITIFFFVVAFCSRLAVIATILHTYHIHIPRSQSDTSCTELPHELTKNIIIEGGGQKELRRNS